MLQKLPIGESVPQEEFTPFLSPAYLLDVVKRRLLLFAAVFIVVLGAGSVVTYMLPAIYLSEGKILVESQQIPSDLVRSTVTAVANERIQIIEQRIMTRDRLLAVANKFQVTQGRISGTDLLDLMRKSSSIKPLEVRSTGRSNQQVIAFTVGFEHERPDIAMRVANEFVTLILEEDIRTRTAFAVETTRFLDREARRLEGELGAVELQIAEIKRRQAQVGLTPGSTNAAPDSALTALRAEILQKSATLANSHPDMRALRQRLANLEKMLGSQGAATSSAAPAAPAARAPAAQATPDLALEPLERQQESLQSQLQSVAQKLSAARLGENLERGQQSEKLEVIEQPTIPQKPIRPNRPKILAVVLAGALAAAGGLVLLLELASSTLRTSADVFRVADSRIVVSIPYITTDAEVNRKKKRLILIGGAMAAAILMFVISVIYFIPDIDLMIQNALSKIQLR